MPRRPHGEDTEKTVLAFENDGWFHARNIITGPDISDKTNEINEIINRLS